MSLDVEHSIAYGYTSNYSRYHISDNPHIKKAYSDIKVLKPRKELCWNKKWFGKGLREVYIKRVSLPVVGGDFNTGQPRKEKEWFCKDCGKKGPYNPGKIRCKPCKYKYYAANRRTVLAKQKKSAYDKKWRADQKEAK